MKNEGNPKKTESEISGLRNQGVERLKRRSPHSSNLAGTDISKLVHELEVHQAELEIQNEELHRVQIELTAAHDHLYDLYEFAPVGYVTLDARAIVQRTNLAMAKMCGQDRGHIIGRRIEELVLPEDRDACFLSIRNAMQTGERQSADLRFPGPDKSTFWAMAEILPIHASVEQGVDAYRITITDVTPRKQMEEELRQNRDRMAWVLEKTGVGMWLNPLPLDRLNWDLQTKNLFFVPPDVEPDLDLFYSRLPPDDREPTRSAFEQAVRNHSLYAVDHRAVNPDTGEVRWIRSIGQATYAADGTPTHFGGVSFDITWRKEAENALARAKDELEERVVARTAELNALTEKLRSLASQVSLAEQRERKRLARILHDHIQQLIVAARLQTEIILHANEPGQIQEAARAAANSLDEALKSSRSLAVDLSPPVLHEMGLIGALKWLADRLKEQYHFTVHLQIDGEAEPTSEESKFLLFDCSREFLFNAVKHSGVASAHLRLERLKYGHLKMTVSDEGRGFDVGLLDQQNPNEIAFGLFHLQQRLWQIGGLFEIASAPGKGTKNIAVVPAVLGQSLETALLESLQDQDQDRFIEISDKSDICRVLIVDDHEIVREGLAKLVRLTADIEIVGKAASGSQAIELADGLKPDVILMDVSLGEMSGPEATRRILQSHPTIKIIGLSVFEDEAVEKTMLDAGAVAYLTKSRDSKIILSTIRDCFKEQNDGTPRQM
jgi:PAS domain S-box-containing protein